MNQKSDNVLALFAARVTYFFFLLLALVLFALGLVLAPDVVSRWGDVSVAIAAALVVAGMTGLFHTFLLEKEMEQAKVDVKTEALGRMMRENGFVDVERNRASASDIILEQVKAATTEIHIVCASLKGLIGTEEDATSDFLIQLTQKVRKGVRLDILFTHPAVAGYRERMELREAGSIPVEVIKNLIRFLANLPTDKGEWQIALYQCGPTLFSFEVDDRFLFLQPYPLCGTSMESFCFTCDMPRSGNLSDFVRKHRDETWTRGEPALVRIKNLDQVSSLVKDLARDGRITREQEEELAGLIAKHRSGGSR